jgi:hypothetical protein
MSGSGDVGSCVYSRSSRRRLASHKSSANIRCSAKHAHARRGPCGLRKDNSPASTFSLSWSISSSIMVATPCALRWAATFCSPVLVERAKLEILADVQNGTHSALVQCFSDLNRFADANAYGGGDDEGAHTALWEKVHERLDAWIKTGVLGRSTWTVSDVLTARRLFSLNGYCQGCRDKVRSITTRQSLLERCCYLNDQILCNTYSSRRSLWRDWHAFSASCIYDRHPIFGANSHAEGNCSEFSGIGQMHRRYQALVKSPRCL